MIPGIGTLINSFAVIGVGILTRFFVKKEIKNLDLWMELDKMASKFEISWNWVKGHSTNEYNNKVDRLARKEAEKIN